MECRKVRTTVLLSCTISPLMPIKPPRLHMVREITCLLTSFQGKPKNTLGKLTRNRPTFVRRWETSHRIKEVTSIGTIESRAELLQTSAAPFHRFNDSHVRQKSRILAASPIVFAT